LGSEDSGDAALSERLVPFKEKYALDILAFLGITVGLVASIVTIIVGFFQIGAMVRKQKRRKASEKHLTAVVEAQRKEVSGTTQSHLLKSRR